MIKIYTYHQEITTVMKCLFPDSELVDPVTVFPRLLSVTTFVFICHLSLMFTCAGGGEGGVMQQKVTNTQAGGLRHWEQISALTNHGNQEIKCFFMNLEIKTVVEGLPF